MITLRDARLLEARLKDATRNMNQAINDAYSQGLLVEVDVIWLSTPLRSLPMVQSATKIKPSEVLLEGEPIK